MGPELDKPTESKSSEIVFKISHLWKVSYQSCTLALSGDVSKQNWDLSCYTKSSGINCTLYSRDLNSLGSQQFSLKKMVFHKIMLIKILSFIYFFMLMFCSVIFHPNNSRYKHKNF